MNCALILKNVQSSNKDIMRDVNTTKDELRKEGDIDIINALE
jgi:hypothetical protein